MSSLRWFLTLCTLATALLAGAAGHSLRAQESVPPRGAPTHQLELSAIRVEESPEQRVLALLVGDRLDEKDAKKVADLSLQLLAQVNDKKLPILGAPFVVKPAEGPGGYELCVALALAPSDADPKVGTGFTVRRRPASLNASADCTVAPADAAHCVERLLAELPARQVEQAGTPTLHPVAPLVQPEDKSGQRRYRFRVVIPVKNKRPAESESPAAGGNRP